MITLYNLADQSFSPLVTADDLKTALLYPAPDFLKHPADQETENMAYLVGEMERMWPVGWSADGRDLLVIARWWESEAWPQTLNALVRVPSQGQDAAQSQGQDAAQSQGQDAAQSQGQDTLGFYPQVLAFGRGNFIDPAWSPRDPQQLAFAWSASQKQDAVQETSNAYLLDLEHGPIYTATQKWHATWSPDGAWVGFSGEGQATIVDQEGKAHFDLGRGLSCPDLAWNPVADLSVLRSDLSTSLTSATGEWRFSNAYFYRDLATQNWYVWGEIFNHSGEDQRILSLTPLLGDTGRDVRTDTQAAFAPFYQEVIQSVSLPDGQGLPVHFVLPSSHNGSDEIPSLTLQVVSELARPSRSDLDVVSDEYDLLAWPDTFHVSGTWENPGADMTERVTILITLYDTSEQVIGWGWQTETSASYLAHGLHYFQVEVELAQDTADLKVRSYKMQLFGN